MIATTAGKHWGVYPLGNTYSITPQTWPLFSLSSVADIDKIRARNCVDFVHLNGSLDSVTVAFEQAHIYRPKSVEHPEHSGPYSTHFSILPRTLENILL
jgi:hypothetical protein